MWTSIRRGLQLGLTLGLILLFLHAIGLTAVIAQLLVRLIDEDARTGTPASLLIFTGLLVFLAGGTSAARTHFRVFMPLLAVIAFISAGISLILMAQAIVEPSLTIALFVSALFIAILWLQSSPPAHGIGHGAPWLDVIMSGLGAGIASGAILGAVMFEFATLLGDRVNVREYLFQMSPEILSLLTLELPPVTSALTYVGFMTATIAVGGLAAKALTLIAGPLEKLPEWWRGTRHSLGRSRTARWLGSNIWVRVIAIALMLGIAVMLPVYLNTFWDYTLGTVGVYVLMGLGLNIVVGLAGLLDLGYVVFFAVGSYTVALLTAPTPHNLLWSFWVTIPIAIGLTTLVGVLLGIPVLRLRGDYLAIVTLGFGEIIRVFLKSDAFQPLTGGPRGVPAIGQPMLFGHLFNSDSDFYYLTLIGIALAIFVSTRLQHSRVGRAWVAMREDETVAQAMGISTLYSKLLAFAVGAAFSGLGGVLYAARNQFTSPEDHTLYVSINILSLVIVGGMGSIPGVILGAFVLKGLPELLREVEQYRILLFGALLVITTILRPQGIWPSARRRLEMHLENEEAEPSTT